MPYSVEDPTVQRALQRILAHSDPRGQQVLMADPQIREVMRQSEMQKQQADLQGMNLASIEKSRSAGLERARTGLALDEEIGAGRMSLGGRRLDMAEAALGQEKKDAGFAEGLGLANLGVQAGLGFGQINQAQREAAEMRALRNRYMGLPA
jgi:hypothetical protein